MADADEDTIPRGGKNSDDVDLSDETQDFRFLASISKEDAVIPKRGEKDFEPHATALQSNTLDASRRAMHNALSYQRVHPPKNHMIATYHPETNMAYTTNPKGPLFAKMGHVRSPNDDPFGNDELRGTRIWLLPEEILFLLERGTVDARWPAKSEDEDGVGLPMSLQAAYAMFIGDEESHAGALTQERFSVYTSLKRSGYTVMRAPSWDDPGPPLGKECYAPAIHPGTWHLGLLKPASIWSMLFPAKSDTTRKAEPEGPLVEPALYSDYSTIYKRLALINFHDPTTNTAPTEPEIPETDPNFRITFHVWKPSTPFKKTDPGSPDFRIAVVNARDTTVPSLQQLNALMETVPYNPPKEGSGAYAKLKNGYKNVVLAIVDQGVTSYLRVSDATFGKEKIYERKGRGGSGKRGGRGGAARGRGRGR